MGKLPAAVASISPSDSHNESTLALLVLASRSNNSPLKPCCSLMLGTIESLTIANPSSALAAMNWSTVKRANIRHLTHCDCRRPSIRSCAVRTWLQGRGCPARTWPRTPATRFLTVGATEFRGEAYTAAGNRSPRRTHLFGDGGCNRGVRTPPRRGQRTQARLSTAARPAPRGPDRAWDASSTATVHVMDADEAPGYGQAALRERT